MARGFGRRRGLARHAVDDGAVLPCTALAGEFAQGLLHEFDLGDAAFEQFDVPVGQFLGSQAVVTALAPHLQQLLGIVQAEIHRAAVLDAAQRIHVIALVQAVAATAALDLAQQALRAS